MQIILKRVGTVFLSLALVLIMALLISRLIVDPETQTQVFSFSSFIQVLVELRDELMAENSMLFRVLGALGVSLIYIISLSLVFAQLLYFLTDRVRESATQVLAVLSGVPTFLSAPILIYIFAYKLQLFPPTYLDEPISFVLPILCLALRPTAQSTLLLLDEILKQHQNEHVNYARAKGLGRFAILRRHILPLSLNSFLAHLPNVWTGILSGTFLIEFLFSLKGLSSLMLESLIAQNQSKIVAITLIFGVMTVIFRQICELLALSLDPRKREQA